MEISQQIRAAPIMYALKRARMAKNMTQAAAAQFFGVSTVSYHNWETGLMQPNSRQIARLADFCGMSTEEVSNALSGFKIQRRRQLEVRGDVSKALCGIPLVGAVTAGTAVDMPPSSSFETLQDYVGDLPQGAFAVKVHGDSMQTDGANSIPEGAVCICAPVDGYMPDDLVGKIVCVRLNGEEHLIKRLVKFNGEYQLQSFNRAYPIIPVQTPAAAVEGVLLLVISKPRSV